MSTSIEVFGRYGGDASVVANAATSSLTAISSAPLNANNQQLAEPVAQAWETYNYTVFGSTVPVPVDIRYTVEIETAGAAEAMSSVYVVDDFGYSYSPQYSDYVTNETNPIPYSPYSQSHQNYVLNTMATPGQENQVSLDISTLASGYLSPTAAYAYAHVDSYIYIDPAFLAAHPGAGFELDSGIGNVNPVPEPSSWALMLGGLGLVGAVLRRRSS